MTPFSDERHPATPQWQHGPGIKKRRWRDPSDLSKSPARPWMTDEERLWAQVVMVENCWQWIGAVNNNGYGRIRAGGRNTQAHRYAYELRRGPIPDGLQIDHLCKNPTCVNPDHLEVVTLVENVMRGTSRAADNARKTHCHRGHPLSGENLSLREDGTRHCRTCGRLQDRGFRYV